MNTEVISLNYHEVTEDPRVFKQARSLVSNGYNVTVLCDWKDGFVQKEQIDGVNIHRFDWQNADDLSPSDFKMFSFLNKSSARIEPLFCKLANTSLQRTKILKMIEKQVSLLEKFTAGDFKDSIAKCGYSKFIDQNVLDTVSVLCDPEISTEQKLSLVATEDFGGEVLSKSYYRDKKGLSRFLSKIEFTRAKSRLAKMAASGKVVTDPTSAAVRVLSLSRELSVLSAAVKSDRRDLYQATSLLFAINLMKQDLVPRPDIIHAHDIYTLPGAISLARHVGAKVVYDAHEFEIERASKMPASGNAMVDDLEMDCLEEVSALITVSETIGDLYSERFSKRKPVIVMNVPEIHTSILENDSSSYRANEGLRSQLGLTEAVPLIVFTGGVQREHRGLDQVILALKLLEGFHLVNLGFRNAGDDQWLMAIARDCGVSDRVHLVPAVDAREVPRMISSCDVSICSFQDATLSYRYAMPNKLFEAAFAQVPIAVSNLPDMRAFVEDLGIGSVMDATDPASIAQTILEIYQNRSKYALSASAKDKLKNVYSWEAQAKKLDRLYQDVLSDP